MTDKKNVTMVELCAMDIPDTLEAWAGEGKETFLNALNLIYFHGGNHINSYVNINRLCDYKKPTVDYFARLGYFSQNAEWDGEIAFYNPTATHQSYHMAIGSEELIWPDNLNLCNRIGAEVWASRLDFLKVDDVFLSEAVVKDGTLTNGHATFTSIILPQPEVMPLESLKKICEFKKAGGRVYFIDGTPYLPDRLEDIKEFRALASEFEAIKFDDAITAIKNECKYPLTLKDDSQQVHMSKYVFEGESAYWLYNTTPTDMTYEFSTNGKAKGFEIYDPTTGEINYIEGSDLTLPLNKLCAKIVVIKN